MSVSGSPQVVGEILSIDVALIDPDMPGRIGQFFPLKAEGLARLIEKDGQGEPIRITRAGNKAKQPWRLVAGLHRLEACRLLGRPVEARVLTGTKEQLRRAQASENADRREMTALENAMFVAAIAEAAQARVAEQHGGLSQQQIAGKARAARGKSHRAGGEVDFAAPERAQDQIAQADAEAQAAMDNLSIAYGWKAEVADACGLSEKKVQRAMRIQRNLVVPHRALVDAIKNHPIADNQDALAKLAGETTELRAAALEWFATNPEATTLDQALVALGAMPSRGGRSADQQEGQTKYLTRAASNLNRLTPSVWRSWAPSLAQTIKPSALLAVRDAIDAQIASLGGADALEDGDA